MDTPVPKPAPRCDGLNGEFYAHCGRGTLCFQRCTDCGAWRHMPREACPGCGSPQWEWARSSGRGTVYSWTVSHRAFHPGFAADLPYASVIVELEEGVRMCSRVVDVAPEALAIGIPLEVVFERHPHGVTLPLFRRRR